MHKLWINEKKYRLNHCPIEESKERDEKQLALTEIAILYEDKKE